MVLLKNNEKICQKITGYNFCQQVARLSPYHCVPVMPILDDTLKKIN